MQTPLQSPTRLAGRIDRLGLYVLLLLGCFAWFYWLWGSVLPACASAVALSLLISRAIQLGERRTLKHREAALRRRIGGEMAVDSLLLQPAASAVSNAVSWMTQVVNLTDFQPKAHGLLAAHDAQRVWVSCLQKHAGSASGCDDVLACVRHARRESADICIVCSTSNFTPEAMQLAEDVTPRTRLMGRSGLIKMAGIAAPATDEQLRALGKRRRQQFRRELWQARILDPAKKRRYMIYGLGLCALYLLSRQLIYLIPALVCLLLFGLCKRKRAAAFTL
ncbi:MAG: hypothetical protein LBN04_02485 [Oscillospiraceae bacterium]|nr:hypothetical protein [Oscillospiraceae bacterium]